MYETMLSSWSQMTSFREQLWLCPKSLFWQYSNYFLCSKMSGLLTLIVCVCRRENYLNRKLQIWCLKKSRRKELEVNNEIWHDWSIHTHPDNSMTWARIRIAFSQLSTALRFRNSVKKTFASSIRASLRHFKAGMYLENNRNNGTKIEFEIRIIFRQP